MSPRTRAHRPYVGRTLWSVAFWALLVCAVALTGYYLIGARPSSGLPPLSPTAFLVVAVANVGALVGASAFRSRSHSTLQASLLASAYPLRDSDSPRFGLLSFPPRLRRDGSLRLVVPATNGGTWHDGHLISPRALDGFSPSSRAADYVGIRTFTTLSDVRIGAPSAASLVLVVQLHSPTIADGDAQLSGAVTPVAAWAAAGGGIDTALPQWLSQYTTGCRAYSAVDDMIEDFPGLQVGQLQPIGRGHLFATTHPHSAITRRQKWLRRNAISAWVVAWILAVVAAGVGLWTWVAEGTDQSLPFPTPVGVVAAAAIGCAAAILRSVARRADNSYGETLS